MATKKKKPKRPHLLSSTRPPPKPTPSLSSRATRSLIGTHHTLQKQLSNAQASQDSALAASLQAKIDAAGGLETYQRASILGQSATRGGDSSRVLMEWLAPLCSARSARKDGEAGPRFRMLEVGALSVENACSRSGLFEMERIDLHSQHAEILEQDFLNRPFPGEKAMEEEGFDVVGLSLVVNYVGNAVERGEMLRRVGGFLRMGSSAGSGIDTACRSWEAFFPALFLVLPASCVLNSRYFDEGVLQRMMGSEGYELKRRKISKKLAYYLWRFRGADYIHRESFAKVQVRTGGARNNFSVVMT